MNKRFGIVLVLALFSFTLFTAGCNLTEISKKPAPDSGTSGAKTIEPPPPNPADTVELKVYFGTRDASHIQAELFVVKREANLLRRSMELLAAGPKQTDHIALLPPGTRVRTVTVKDRTASVDFTGEILKRGGGSAMELLAVGAIVNTLTEFPDIEKVQILVEGRKVSTLFGHMDVSEALSRSPAIIKK